MRNLLSLLLCSSMLHMSFYPPTFTKICFVLSLVSSSYTIMYLGFIFFVFILHGIWCDSQIYWFLFLIKCENFLFNISSKFLYLNCSFLFFQVSSFKYIRSFLSVSQVHSFQSYFSLHILVLYFFIFQFKQFLQYAFKFISQILCIIRH